MTGLDSIREGFVLSPATPATAALPPGPPATCASSARAGCATLQHLARTYGDFVPLCLLCGTAILLNRPE